MKYTFSVVFLPLMLAIVGYSAYRLVTWLQGLHERYQREKRGKAGKKRL